MLIYKGGYMILFLYLPLLYMLESLTGLNLTIIHRYIIIYVFIFVSIAAINKAALIIKRLERILKNYD